MRYLYRKISTEKQINHARNAMVADGHFGAGMCDCDVVGINGDCGPETCPVYLVSKYCNYKKEENNNESNRESVA